MKKLHSCSFSPLSTPYTIIEKGQIFQGATFFLEPPWNWPLHCWKGLYYAASPCAPLETTHYLVLSSCVNLIKYLEKKWKETLSKITFISKTVICPSISHYFSHYLYSNNFFNPRLVSNVTRHTLQNLLSTLHSPYMFVHLSPGNSLLNGIIVTNSPIFLDI